MGPGAAERAAYQLWATNSNDSTPTTFPSIASATAVRIGLTASTPASSADSLSQNVSPISLPLDLSARKFAEVKPSMPVRRGRTFH